MRTMLVLFLGAVLAYPQARIPGPGGSAAAAGSAIAILAGANGHTSAAGVNGVTTTAINTTGATLLVVALSNYTNGPANTLTDSKSNTWVALTAKTSTAGNDRIRLYYAVNPTVGSGHTFTSSGTGVYTAIAVLAFANADTVSPFNSETGQDDQLCDTNVNTARPGSITVAQGDLEVAADTIPFGFTMSMTVDSSFSIVETINTGSTEGFAVAYYVPGSTGALNPGFNTNTSSLHVGVVAGSFKHQ